MLLGGMTTANFSDRFFARGYVAYGLKGTNAGNTEANWNIPSEKKKYHSREFPMNGIRLSYTCDVDKLGQHYMTNHASNLLRSIKRRESDLVTYRRPRSDRVQQGVAQLTLCSLFSPQRYSGGLPMG